MTERTNQNQFRRLDPEIGYIASSNPRYNMRRAKEERGLREMLSSTGEMTIRVINPRNADPDGLIEAWDREVDGSFTTYVHKTPEEIQQIKSAQSAKKKSRTTQKPYRLQESTEVSQPTPELSLEEEAAQLKRITPTDAERARVKTALKALVRGERSDLYIAGFMVSKYVDLNIVLGARSETDTLSYAVAHFMLPTQEFHLRFTPNLGTRGIWAYDVYVRDRHDWTHGDWEDLRVYEYVGHPQPRDSLMRATEYLFGRQRDRDIWNNQFLIPINHLTDKKFPQIVKATKNPPR